jgi:hypothetical protein
MGLKPAATRRYSGLARRQQKSPRGNAGEPEPLSDSRRTVTIPAIAQTSHSTDEHTTYGVRSQLLVLVVVERDAL